ncbi:MAG: hypothetical protein HYW79_02540 [Parcubacteria group bacterium]|nr:hypothetical protein [Parcubacteria group bacterium]
MNLKIKITIAILVVVALVAAGFYLGYQKYLFPLTKQAPETVMEKPAETVKPEPEKSPAPTPSPPSLTSVMPGYKLYKNADFGFEIQYPVSWMVIEEVNENVRGEMVKEFYFKKPTSDLRFAILPRDGLSYGLPSDSTTENINISGFLGVQTKYITADGRRLLLVHPQVNTFNWDKEIGRLDIMSSALDPVGDFVIFNKMLSSFKFSR